MILESILYELRKAVSNHATGNSHSSMKSIIKRLDCRIFALNSMVWIVHNISSYHYPNTIVLTSSFKSRYDTQRPFSLWRQKCNLSDIRRKNVYQCHFVLDVLSNYSSFAKILVVFTKKSIDTICTENVHKAR